MIYLFRNNQSSERDGILCYQQQTFCLDDARKNVEMRSFFFGKLILRKEELVDGRTSVRQMKLMVIKEVFETLFLELTRIKK